MKTKEPLIEEKSFKLRQMAETLYEKKNKVERQELSLGVLPNDTIQFKKLESKLTKRVDGST
jgi:hypothetical protein